MTVGVDARRQSRAGASRASTGELHAAAWLAWLVAGSAAVFLTSNPLYLSLALLAALAVYVSAGGRARRRAMGPFVAIGLVLAAMSVPFNLLTGSTGPTVLTTLPELRFPDWFGGVTLGGDVTGEALLSATARALSIATIVVLAGAFNASVDHFRLLRLAPRGLTQVMLALTIALLVVPQAVGQARAVLEAQRLRGRRARGLRALPGVLLPTLQGALERSVQRAESLDARGFGGGERRGGAMTSIAGVAGLGVCAWGAFAHFYYGSGAGPALAIAAGTGVVVMALFASGGVRRAHMRSDGWSPRDVAVGIAAMASVALLLALRLAAAGDADYLPYPEVVAPAFHPAGAVAALLLLLPALIVSYRPDAEEAL